MEISKEERAREDQAILSHFPILDGSFVYLDNGATTQKPQEVIDAEKRFYETENANPMRGLYQLSLKATADYEDARLSIAIVPFNTCQSSNSSRQIILLNGY